MKFKICVSFSFQYINKQGGTRSPQLCFKTWEIWNWAIQNQIYCSSRCRQGQHFGRRTEQVQGNTHRMDLEQSHCTSDFSEVGLPTGRSVCVPSEQTNTSLLFMDSRSEYPGNRCSDNFLGRHVCLGVPSNMPDFESNSTHAQVSLSDHSDSSPVAQETLVYRNPESIDSLSNQTTSIWLTS